MNLVKTEKLFEEYPDLFKKELLTHNFDCQDGWFVLLDELGGQILQHSDHCSENEKIEIVQIKQKMGALRIYVRGGNEVVLDLIKEAEDKSKSICELDGEPASGLCVCAPHWYRYLCKKCADLHGYMTIEDYHPENIEVVPLHIQTQ